MEAVVERGASFWWSHSVARLPKTNSQSESLCKVFFSLIPNQQTHAIFQ
jgi:hypothetical protein